MNAGRDFGMRALVLMIRHAYKRGGMALVGQLLNFAAMLLPILLGRGPEVAFLVVVGAISGILTHSASLSFASVYPALPTARTLIAVQSSAISLLGTGAFMAALSVVIAYMWPPAFPYVIWASLLLLCQGLYIMTAARLVRLGDPVRYSKYRLGYGIVNIATTGLACLLSGWTPALVAGASLVFLVMSLLGIATDGGYAKLRARRLFVVEWSSILAYSRQFSRASVGNFTAGIAFQLSAFFVPLTGSYSSAWASILRLGGGFATISHHVISPAFEMDFAAAIREGSIGRARKEVRKASIVGILLATPSSVVAVLLTVWSVDYDPESDFANTMFMLAGVLYVWGIIAPSVLMKYLVLMGAQKSYLAWAIAKALMMIALVLNYEAVALIVGFAAVELAFSLVYMVLVTYFSRKEPGNELEENRS